MSYPKKSQIINDLADTIADNPHYDGLVPANIEDLCVDHEEGSLSFVYEGHWVVLDIKVFPVPEETK